MLPFSTGVSSSWVLPFSTGVYSRPWISTLVAATGGSEVQERADAMISSTGCPGGHGGRHGMKVIRNVLAVVIVLVTTLSAAAPSDASVIKPTVTGFSASTTSLYRTGGTITLSAMVANATACTFRSNKPIAGMPGSALCTNGPVVFDVMLPANMGTKPVRYTFTLVVTGARAVRAKPIVRVTVGIATQPPSLLTAISAGSDFACALYGGTVDCWGGNESGQLGNGNNTGPIPSCTGYPCSPRALQVPGLTGVTSIAAGGGHACAITSGTVECWGRNDFGQLGNGTTAVASTYCGPCGIPVRVVGLSGITAIDTGSAHSCALLADQTVACWGYNYYGELGNGTNVNSNMPVKVSGLTGVMAIAAGNFFNCALLSDGTVDCWGSNGFRNLGNGGGADSNVPVAVSGLSGVVAISAGLWSACALLIGGTVECWGFNGFGQLGIGTSVGPETCPTGSCSSLPVAVQGLTGVGSIVAGSGDACALLSDGTVDCWGYGEPSNSVPPSSVPLPISGLGQVSSIALGGRTTCVLLLTGVVKCWGSNLDGELGDGTLTSSVTPVTVTGLPSP